MRANPTRQGFLILIMIAFASILLGLATTFFIYCSKSLESSGDAVRYAQSRIALHGALNYVFRTFNRANDGDALSTLFPTSNPVILSFDSTEGNPRAMKMGYARIALVANSLTMYGTTTMDLLDGNTSPGVAPNDSPGAVPPPADLQFNITVGCGPSQGVNSVSSPLEIRRIYPLTVNVTQCGTAVSPPAVLSGNNKMVKLTLGAPYTTTQANW